MQLIYENDDIALFAYNIYRAFKLFFQRSAVFGARHQRAHVQREHRLVFKQFGYVAFHYRTGKPFYHSALTYARFADKHGVVLCLTAKNLNYPLYFFVTAYDGIELVFAGAFGQIDTQIVKFGGQFAVAALGGMLFGLLLAVYILFEFGNKFVLVHAQIAEYCRRRTGRINQQTVQNLLGADDLAAEFHGKTFGVDESVCRAGRKAQPPQRNAGFVDKVSFKVVGVDAVFSKQLSGSALLVDGKPVQYVFGAHRRIAVRRRDVFGLYQYFFCIFGIR